MLRLGLRLMAARRLAWGEAAAVPPLIKRTSQLTKSFSETRVAAVMLSATLRARRARRIFLTLAMLLLLLLLLLRGELFPCVAARSSATERQLSTTAAIASIEMELAPSTSSARNSVAALARRPISVGATRSSGARPASTLRARTSPPPTMNMLESSRTSTALAASAGLESTKR